MTVDEETSLATELAAWTKEAEPLLRGIGRAAAFHAAGLYYEAAIEYESLLTWAPKSDVALSRAIAEYRISGNHERAALLEKQLTGEDEAVLEIQTGHTDAIAFIQFSPDETLLASAGMDRSIILWDMQTGLQLRRLLGHGDVVTSLAFSPDGRTLISGSRDRTVRLWNLSMGRERGLLQHQAEVTSVSISPDGLTIATGTRDGKVMLWDPATGALKKELVGQAAAVNSVAFGPDGTALATGSDDNSVRIWDLTVGAVRRTISLEVPADRTLAFVDAKGQTISKPPAVVTDAVKQIAWSVRNQLLTVNTSVQNLELNGIEFSVRLWNPETGAPVRTLSKFQSGGQPMTFLSAGDADVLNPLAVSSLASFSGDGTQIVGRVADYGIAVWEADTGKELLTFPAIQFDPDAARAREIRKRFEAASWHWNPHHPVLSRDRRLAAYVVEDKVSIWDIEAKGVFRTFGSQARPVASVAFGSGNIMVSANTSLPTKVWDLSAARLVWTFRRSGFPIGSHSISLSADGETLAAASDSVFGPNASIDLWKLDSGQKVQTIMGPSSGVFGVAFVADGNLVAGRLDDSLSVWTPGGIKLRELNRSTYTGNPLAVSPNGLLVAHTSWGAERFTGPGNAASSAPGLQQPLLGPTANVVGSIAIWSLRTGQRIQELSGDSGQSFYALAFSPDGKLLAAAGTGNVTLWELAQGAKRRSLTHDSDTFYSVAFSPDGKTVAGGGSNGTVSLWDVTNDKPRAILIGHGSDVRSVAFSPDGRLLASGSSDGSIRLWRLPKGEHLVTVIPLAGDNYVIATPDNYYTASRSSLAGVAFRVGNHAYPFVQFDLRLNRPDIVLQRILGGSSSELVSAYRRAYEHRLKRLKMTRPAVSGDLRLPEVSITTPLPTMTTDRTIAFSATATDPNGRLDRLNVAVNGVPVHGSGGLFLRPLGQGSITQQVSLVLSTGDNKIEVSALTTDGLQSLPKTVNIVKTPRAAAGKTYVIAVGVSSYVDRGLRPLPYAAKDAEDVVAFFRQTTPPESLVAPDPIVNSAATHKRIAELEATLAQAGVDDTVIMFVAGHGLLDERFDYYFAPHDTQLGRLDKSALSFDAMSSLLEKAGARQKLLLVDTCHAGEIDYSASPRQPREARTSSSQSAVQRRPLTSFELMHELFADLRKGSGTETIGASGGAEMARERADQKNGVFTSALLEGLKGAADRNGDTFVTLWELRDYVGEAVVRATNGAQRPTGRGESVASDFVVVRVKAR
jgi:WD40 repeat protein/uncharacterized caspase-like protein